LLTAAGAVAGPPHDDPVFGVPYDAKQVHFEDAPAKIGELCTDLRGKGRTFSLYAYWGAGDMEYMVVSDAVSQDTGVGVVLHGDVCYETTAEDLMNGVYFSNPKKGEAQKQIEALHDALNGLAADLLRRYTVAFGGKQKFLRELHKLPHFDPADLAPLLRKRFEEYAKQP
jgi:hypothetical protein